MICFKSGTIFWFTSVEIDQFRWESTILFKPVLTNQPIELIGLPTTGSISLAPPAGDKLYSGGLKVQHWNGVQMVLPSPGGGLGGPHWGLLNLKFTKSHTLDLDIQWGQI